MSALTILFVDDEPLILKTLPRLVGRARREWTLETALSGEAALALLERTAFDVIVSDMRMPGMNGAELLEQVIARAPNIGRIILSGHAELAERDRALRVAHEFLSKPSSRDEVIASIERVSAYSPSSS